MLLTCRGLHHLLRDLQAGVLKNLPKIGKILIRSVTRSGIVSPRGARKLLTTQVGKECSRQAPKDFASKLPRTTGQQPVLARTNSAVWKTPLLDSRQNRRCLRRGKRLSQHSRF